MGAFLGIDLGSKRVGVAVCPEGVSIASPYTTIEFKSRAYLKEEILKIIKEYGVTEIVVGLPQMMNGTPGLAAVKVQGNVEWLKAQIPISWVFWDERLSSKEAERILIQADVSRERRREVIDQIAAQRILQSYLDAKR